MSEGEKKWPAAQLRRRGWTDALIKELLPAPLYVREGRWTARAWLKADVLAAERDPRFLSPSPGCAPPPACSRRPGRARSGTAAPPGSLRGTTTER